MEEENGKEEGQKNNLKLKHIYNKIELTKKSLKRDSLYQKKDQSKKKIRKAGKEHNKIKRYSEKKEKYLNQWRKL